VPSVSVRGSDSSEGRPRTGTRERRRRQNRLTTRPMTAPRHEVCGVGCPQREPRHRETRLCSQNAGHTRQRRDESRHERRDDGKEPEEQRQLTAWTFVRRFDASVESRLEPALNGSAMNTAAHAPPRQPSREPARSNKSGCDRSESAKPGACDRARAVERMLVIMSRSHWSTACDIHNVTCTKPQIRPPTLFYSSWMKTSMSTAVAERQTGL